MTPKVEDSRSVPKYTNPDTIDLEALGITPKQYEPFTPILDRVLIRRIEDTQKSKLGVPDKYRQHTNRGVIVGIGDLVKSNLKIGDIVLFGEYSAERFEKDGEELWLVREANIRGVERLKPAGIPLGVE